MSSRKKWTIGSITGLIVVVVTAVAQYLGGLSPPLP